MDLSTIVGILAGLAVIVAGIGGGSIQHFIHVPSLFIVVGGTFMALIASYPISVLRNVPRHIGIIFKNAWFRHEQCIETLTQFSQEARKNGILELEKKAEDLNDPFLKSAVMMIVDAHDPAEIKDLLNMELDYMIARHEIEIGLYEKGTVLAPAFGMIGTLIGLINMLMGLDLASGASSALGENMSVALITTFYGCVLANLIFAPLAKKLEIRNEEEYLYKQLIIEGVLAIQAGDNPKFLKEKLYCFLNEKKTVSINRISGERKEKRRRFASGKKAA